MSHDHFEPPPAPINWPRAIAWFLGTIIAGAIVIAIAVSALTREEPALEGYKRIEVEGRPYILMWGTDRHSNPFTTIVPDPSAP